MAAPARITIRRGRYTSERKVMGAAWRFLCGMCLLFCISSAAAWGQSRGNPLDNPFSDPDPSVDPQPLQGPPGAVPYSVPPLQPVPMPQPTPEPTTLGDLLFGDGRKSPEDNRNGAFQRLSFVNAYLPRMGANGFGWYDAALTTVWGFPLPTKDAPLVITPGIATHWLDGPANLDIPAQLHEAYTEFRWLPKIGEQFRLDVAVQPGYYSDWDGSSARAFRVTGHLSGIYDWTPTFQFVLGAAYLDRPDIEVLPVAGVIWKPRSGEEYRLVFPEPKISWCIDKDPDIIIRENLAAYQPPVRTELWFYLAGELGGGTWAIRHSDGTSDLMSYGDWRVFTGMETKSLLFVSSFVEVGFVFHRLIHLGSTGEDTQVGNTAMVRGGLYF
jgi:hypothetical protein